jgi:hypothetical protein
LNLNLRINRVTSKEYKERQERHEKNYPNATTYNHNLTNSLYAKPFNIDNQLTSEKLTTSTAVTKFANTPYLNPRGTRDTYSSYYAYAKPNNYEYNNNTTQESYKK